MGSEQGDLMCDAGDVCLRSLLNRPIVDKVGLIAYGSVWVNGDNVVFGGPRGRAFVLGFVELQTLERMGL